MSPPIFIDANIPIYAAGRPQPLKEPCARILSLAAEHPELFFTDTEVLQELMHRYLALRLWARGKEVLERFSTILYERVEPVYAEDVSAAASLADQHVSSGFSARDLLHAAIILRAGATEVASADRDFSKLSEKMELLEPEDFEVWRSRIEVS